MYLSRMEAVFLKQYGDADSAFERRKTRMPEPGPGHALIKTEVFGLNFAEVLARKGMYPDSPPLPFVPGYEVVGEVVQVGEGVSTEWVGKRVASMLRFGGYSEYCVAPEIGMAEIGPEMDAGKAAALCVQYTTAWHCAMQCLHLRPGDRVLVHSAAGGVGTALVQICKWIGCEVFGTAGSDAKCEIARANGADHAINYTTQDYQKEITKLLGRDKLDATFNAVAGKTFKKDLKLLGAGGRLILFGAAARTGNRKGKFGTIRLLAQMGLIIPLTFVGSSKGVIGVNILRVGDYKPRLLAEAMQQLVKLVDEGILNPQVGAIYELDNVAQAHSDLEHRKTTGKVIVRWK